MVKGFVGKIVDENGKDTFLEETLKNPTAKVGYLEAEIRSYVAKLISEELRTRDITATTFAETIDVSNTQMDRLLNHDIGGALHLLTIVRAANTLGFGIRFSLEK